MTEARLRRLQWAVRATLTLGVAASVTANILHARPHPVSQAIAAWPPLALLITVELVSRIPVYRRGLGVVRVVATSAIAGIAAWVSYHHMAAVVARYGETGTVPYLLPLSVDGLIVVASVSLVELAGRRRDTASSSAPAATDAPAAPIRTPAVPGITLPVPVQVIPAEPATVASSAGGQALAGAANLARAQGAAGGVGLHDLRPDRSPDPDEVDDHERDAENDAEADDIESDTDLGEDEGGKDPATGDDADLAPDLVPLLPASRIARDELTREGRTVSRDALARRIRRNGHTIRNNRVSELLAALRREAPSVNGHRPAASVNGHRPTPSA